MILLIPFISLLKLTLVSNTLSAHQLRSEAADLGATSLGLSNHRHARYRVARKIQDAASHSSTRASPHPVNLIRQSSAYKTHPQSYTETYRSQEQYSTAPSNQPSRPRLPSLGSILGGSINVHTDFLDHFSQIFLEAHNQVRQTYAAPRLVWNRKLVAAAKVITDTCNWKHTVNNPYGENIAAGQASPQEVVSQWVDGPEEKSSFDPANPKESHFTQLVWKDSLQLGCAVTSCRTMTGVSLPQSPIQFWACEYDPPGNVETEYVQNVNAVAGGMPKGAASGGSVSESYSFSVGVGFRNH